MSVTANKVTKILYDKLVLKKIGFMMYYLCQLLVSRMIERNPIVKISRAYHH